VWLIKKGMTRQKNKTPMTVKTNLIGLIEANEAASSPRLLEIRVDAAG
jgi:hypothetical protein